MNPKVAEMLVPAISRLDIRFDDFDTYIDKVKQAPYIHFWDDAMLHYYQADVATADDGTVEPRSSIADIFYGFCIDDNNCSRILFER